MFALLRMILICVFGSLLSAEQANAAEVKCIKYLERGPCRAALLLGEIVKGDYDKVAAIYAQNHPYLESFSLLSNGGDVEEAIKIGRLFRRYLIGAYAPFGHGESASLPNYGNPLERTCLGTNCVCASSCALVWFGATLRLGTVGLHRPRFVGTGFAGLSPAEAEQAYKPLLAYLADYLVEMEAPKTAIEAMITTSSAEVEWIDGGRLDRSPSFAEWLEAACGHLARATQDEVSLYMNLLGKAKLSETEKALLPLLEQKIHVRNECEGSLISKSRAKLPPPDVLSTANDPPKSTARLTPSAQAESNAPVHKDQNSKRRGWTVRELGESLKEKE
jgi:hypothetical protein